MRARSGWYHAASARPGLRTSRDRAAGDHRAPAFVHRGEGMGQQLALSRETGDASLLAVLKALEIQRTLGTEPVLTALRHFPAQPAQLRGLPAGPPPAARRDAAGPGHRAACTPTSARPSTHAARRAGHGGGDAHRLRQDPLLQPARPRPHPEGPRDARALYLFPTKALAQDQLAELYGVIEGLGADIGTFTYDGDTPQDARKAIRARAHVVVTNPDMLHKGILPHHTKWVKLFENLRYVVVDELHSHRGVYGSHVANIFRRLPRLCEFYGSRPQFLCSSATIGNPRELAEALTGRRDDAGRRERRAARRALLRHLQPAGGEPAAGHPALRPRLRARRRALLPGQGAADDRLRALAPLHRDPRHLPEGGAGDAPGLRGRHPRLPRRLPAPEAARDRARPARRARCWASCPPTRWSWGSTSAASTSRCCSATRAAWPPPGSRRAARAAARGPRSSVLVANSTPLNQFIARNPDYFFGSPVEAGPHQPGQPPHPGQPREVRGLRAALHRRRALRRARTWTRSWGSSRRSGSCTGPATAGTGRARATPPTRSACAACPPTTSWSRTSPASRGSSPRWTSTARPPRCTRRRSTSSRAGRTSSRSTTTRSAAPTCARRRWTTTPTPSPTPR